jgi:hypothetical protein
MPKQAYYAARAIAERRQSQAATDPRAAAAHAELSARYEALAADPNLELATDDSPSLELASHEAPTDAQPSPEDQAVWSPAD